MSKGRPNIPSIERAVDLIWRMAIDNCDAPLTVWAEKLWPALGRAILAWYTIDLMNIFTSYMKPGVSAGVGRSSRHWGGGHKSKRKGVRGAVGKVLSFDPGEFIGEHLWGAEELRMREVTPGVLMMWSIYGVIERVGYYFMVLDIVGDFLYEWCSSVVQAGYCGAREDSVLYATTPDFEQLGIVGWWPEIYANTLKARRLSYYNGVGVAQITGPGILYFAASGLCYSGGEGGATFSIRLRCLGGESVDKTYTASVNMEPGQEIGLNVGGDCLAGDLWITEVAVNGHFLIRGSEFLMHAVWRHYQ